MRIKVIREEDFLPDRKIIREEDFLNEQKSYENDLPLSGNEIEDIDIVPVKHIPASENIPVEDEEEKKLRIMYDILTLKETDQDTTEEVVEELINKSVEELLTIYEELKESKTKSLK